MDILVLEQIITSLAVLANVLLGSIIFSKNRRSATNTLFLLLAITLSLSSFANYFSIQNYSDGVILFWIRTVMFFAAPMALFFYLFVVAYPKTKLVINKIWFYSISAITMVNMIIASSPLLFSGISHASGNVQPLPGAGAIFYMFWLVFFLILGIVLLVRHYIRGDESIKQQLRYLIIGLGITFGLILFFNVIMVNVFNNSSFQFLAGVFTLVYIYFTGYAIIKHQLFDIKMIATEITVVLLSAALLAEVFVSQSTMEALSKSLIWVVATYGGWVLIGTVRKEISQREKIEKLAKELGEANEKLKDLDMEKSNFLSMASHELNSPLSAIRGYLSMIIDEKIGGTLSPTHQKYLTNVYVSAERLIHLVKDLLNVSRIEQKRIHLIQSEIDINGIINQALAETKPNIDSMKHHLEVKLEKDLPKTWGDADRITEIVINLISNSAKYTDVGGKLEVGSKKTDGQIEVWVKDNGFGIPKDSQDKIFGKFEQGNLVRDQRKGTGLGLFIVKNLIELHHGKIWFESEEGKGTTFHFSLPIIKEKPADAFEGKGAVIDLNDRR